MEYKVLGPYDVPRHKANKRFVPLSAKSDFWENIKTNIAKINAGNLPDACGCYVFLVGKRVWYIGKAESQTFEQECFTADKLAKYNEALQHKQSKPRLIFLVKITKAGRITKPSSNGHKDIEALEKLLIGIAVQQNEKLLNVHHARLFSAMCVPGVLNTRKGQGRADAVIALRKALGTKA